MSEVEQTQQLIVQKLDESGKLGKMRAMVTEASLAAINADEEDMFSPSRKLKETKSNPDGAAAFALVHDFLKTLGLAYTAKVLEMETSLPSERLPTKGQLIGRFGGDAPDGKPLLLKVMADAEGAPMTAAAPGPVIPAKSAIPVAKPAATPVPKAAAPAPVAASKYGSVSSSDLGSIGAATAAKIPSPKKAAVPSGEKPDDNLYSISEFDNRELYRFNQVQGQQVQLEYLKNCKVYILDEVDSITVDDCEDTEIIIAACEGSIFLRTCKNVQVTAACKQLRTRDCEFMDLNLFAGTDPVIESSHHINFRPFNLKAPKMIENFKAARLDAKMNRFPHVYDFTSEDPKIPTPHYELHYPEHNLKMVSVGEKFGTPECPPEIVDMLEFRLEPAPSSESGQNKSYNIKTGGQQWSKLANEGREEDESPKKEAAAAPVGGGPSTKLPPTPAAATAAPVPVPKPAAAAVNADKGGSDSDYSSFNDDSDDDKSDKMSYSTDSDTF